MAVFHEFRQRHRNGAIVILTALVILAPLLIYRRPFFESSPDSLYVKGKVLQVAQGNLFTDPVSGYDTMHPFLYHLALAGMRAVGITINASLILLTTFNIIFLFWLTFLIVRQVYGETSAVLTCLLLPFIAEFMGSREILLATAFYFSVPFYLAGLWCYLKPEKTIRQAISTAVLWGVAFLISPVHFFLIGFVFVYELVFIRQFRRCLTLLAVFFITLIPFAVQVITVYRQNLWGASVFAFWRGIPDWSWWQDFLLEYISPCTHKWLSVPCLIHFALLLVAGYFMLRARKLHPYIIIAALAYVLTFYHFSGQYAIRIQLFLSIFLVATAVTGLQTLKINRLVWVFPWMAIALFALYHQLDTSIDVFAAERRTKAGYYAAGGQLWDNLNRYLERNRYIFCEKDVYRQYVMPFAPVHALSAYKTLEYFQLKPEIAREMERDYRLVLQANDYHTVSAIAKKYNINKAVVGGGDLKLPLFRLLTERWKEIYLDNYFIILQNPD